MLIINKASNSTHGANITIEKRIQLFSFLNVRLNLFRIIQNKKLILEGEKDS